MGAESKDPCVCATSHLTFREFSHVLQPETPVHMAGAPKRIGVFRLGLPPSLKMTHVWKVGLCTLESLHGCL